MTDEPSVVEPIERAAVTEPSGRVTDPSEGFTERANGGTVGAEESVPLATRLADPGDYVREQLIEGDLGDPWDMPLWQREHLARVIEHYTQTSGEVGTGAGEGAPGQDGALGMAELLGEHEDIAFDLGTPRQYTQHGGWNQSCGCGYPLGDAGSGDDDGQERVNANHRAHVADVLARAGYGLVADMRAQRDEAQRYGLIWKKRAEDAEETVARVEAAARLAETLGDKHAREAAGLIRAALARAETQDE